jgi:hypothetical protein
MLTTTFSPGSNPWTAPQAFNRKEAMINTERRYWKRNLIFSPGPRGSGKVAEADDKD